MGRAEEFLRAPPRAGFRRSGFLRSGFPEDERVKLRASSCSANSYNDLARPLAWPRRFTVVALFFLATVLCYVDRVSISVAIIPLCARSRLRRRRARHHPVGIFLGLSMAATARRMDVRSLRRPARARRRRRGMVACHAAHSARLGRVQPADRDARAARAGRGGELSRRFTASPRDGRSPRSARASSR